MINGIHLNYNSLREVNPKAARKVLLQVLNSSKGNISLTSRILNTSRKTIYKAKQKEKEGVLDDKSRIPKTIHNKTEEDIEKKIIEIKQKTRYGPKRIARELELSYKIKISKHTVRNVVRRNRDKLNIKIHRVRRRQKREFVDWYKAKPFEIVQIDLKYIIDQKALSKEQIEHIYEKDLPIYQWSALDVNSRFKLIGYSKEKTWTNGLTWYLWVISWLRSHGVKNEIVFTVDNGEEFGGKSWMKVKELRKLIGGFGCKLIQNNKGHCEENAHVERSHRTDDDEFYIPRILKINNKEEFYKESLNYIYYYNNVREHSGINDMTPYQKLKMLLPKINDKTRIVAPITLDKVSVDLGTWSGYEIISKSVYHVQAQNQTTLLF